MFINENLHLKKKKVFAPASDIVSFSFFKRRKKVKIVQCFAPTEFVIDSSVFGVVVLHLVCIRILCCNYPILLVII